MACHSNISVILFLICCVISLCVFQIRGACDVVSVGRDYTACAHQHSTLNKLLRTKTRVSGQDMVDVFNDFCAARDSIHTCVKDRIRKAGCLTSESGVSKLEEDFAISEFYCNEDKLMDMISDVFIAVPQVNLHPGENECLQVGSHRREVCSIEIALALAMGGTASIRDKREGLVESMLCTYRGFDMVGCTLKEGLTMTIALYAEMVVPPLLGVNISRPLFNVVNYFEEHNIVDG